MVLCGSYRIYIVCLRLKTINYDIVSIDVCALLWDIEQGSVSHSGNDHGYVIPTVMIAMEVASI